MKKILANISKTPVKIRMAFFVVIILVISSFFLLAAIKPFAIVNTEVCILDIVNGTDADVPIVSESPVKIRIEFKARPVTGIERLSDWMTVLTKEGGDPIILVEDHNLNMIYSYPTTKIQPVTVGTWTVVSTATVRNVGDFINSITFIVDFGVVTTTTITTEPPVTTTTTTTTTHPTTTTPTSSTIIYGGVNGISDFGKTSGFGFILLIALIPLVIVYKKWRKSNET